MGYSIYIGEWDKSAKAEDGPTIPVLYIAEAPAFDGDADHTNRRMPSYTAWHRFCAVSGLAGLFEGVGSLFAEHPGTVRLTKRHARIVGTALKMYRVDHPKAMPSFLSDDEHDRHLARLMWLAWWVDWALANCKRPAIHNR